MNLTSIQLTKSHALTPPVLQTLTHYLAAISREPPQSKQKRVVKEEKFMQDRLESLILLKELEKHRKIEARLSQRVCRLQETVQAHQQENEMLCHALERAKTARKVDSRVKVPIASKKNNESSRINFRHSFSSGSSKFSIPNEVLVRNCMQMKSRRNKQ